MLGFFSAVLVILSTLTVTILYRYPDMQMSAETLSTDSSGRQDLMSLVQDGADRLSELKDDKASLTHQLRLTIPESADADDIKIRQNSDYLGYTIRIPDISASYFYDYPIIGSCEGIRDMTYGPAGDDGIIEILTDKIYVLDETFDGNYMYIDFVRPSDYYDKVVVIDAGHGGNDGGAENGGVFEKSITLKIVKKIKSIFDDSEYNRKGGIGVYYTRLTDTYVSLQDRRKLTRETDADLFLSVHINSTATGRESSINGTSVMYKVSDKSGESKKFAQIVLDSLLDTLGTTSKGLIAGDEIYIIRTAKMPVALAEIGFITNPQERKKMCNEGFQNKTAQALYDAVLDYLY